MTPCECRCCERARQSDALSKAHVRKMEHDHVAAEGDLATRAETAEREVERLLERCIAAEGEIERLRAAITFARGLVGTEAEWKIPTVLHDACRSTSARPKHETECTCAVVNQEPPCWFCRGGV